MDEEIETLVVRVRADTQGLSRDVEAMRAGIEGPLGDGAERAGRRIEQGLLRAVRTGKFGFEDLRRIALSVLDEIAGSALRGAMGGSGGGAGGLVNLGASLLTSALGLPGRATGGPVAPGQIVFLVRSEAAPPAAIAVAEQLFLSSDGDSLRQLLAAPTLPTRLRVFHGFASWAPDQLEGEIDRGDWYLLPVDGDVLFADPLDKMWPKLWRRATQVMVRGPAAAPERAFRHSRGIAMAPY